MVLEILCVEPIYPQYSGVLETCLALRYCFFEVFGSESAKKQVTQLHVRVIFFKLYFVRACYGIFHRQEETPLINGSI